MRIVCRHCSKNLVRGTRHRCRYSRDYDVPSSPVGSGQDYMVYATPDHSVGSSDRGYSDSGSSSYDGGGDSGGGGGD